MGGESNVVAVALAFVLADVVGPLEVESVPDVEDDIPVERGVDVLAHLHKEEPVAVVTLAQHARDVIPVHGADAVAEQQEADMAREEKLG